MIHRGTSPPISIELLTMEKFTHFVEDHKVRCQYKTYIETIMNIIKQEYYLGLTTENVKKYLHKSLINKLELNYSDNNYLEKENVIEPNLLW